MLFDIVTSSLYVKYIYRQSDKYMFRFIPIEQNPQVWSLLYYSLFKLPTKTLHLLIKIGMADHNTLPTGDIR